MTLAAGAGARQDLAGVLWPTERSVLTRAGPQPVENHRGDRVGNLVGGQGAAGSIPLDQRVDGAENESARQCGIHSGADAALIAGFLDQVADDVIELSAAGQCAPFGSSVPRMRSSSVT